MHLLNADGKRKYYNVSLSITNNIKTIVIILFIYILIPLFNSSVWLLNWLLSVFRQIRQISILDRTGNDDREQEEERKHCRRCLSQRRQNKSPISNALAKQKNLSADTDIWKMPNIGRYIGRPLPIMPLFTKYVL